ncbi:hypothetical protein ACGFSG_26400 [Streptomyces sp. NPDC048512]|uniref:hypothetical protein n=1 Tax=unclassified Streptomyces TaxID=2593676 RepID=UPI0009BEAE5E|nr:hypothetical protein [Streptomyces sp. M41(2017)]OQQ13747.1 hypothetical protein B0675_26195 [Streptomyces sp. M41(2017)]
MEWGTVVSVIAGGLVGLSGDTIGRIGARHQAQRARQEALEDAETARRHAIEDEGRKTREDRERRAVENILRAYLEHPIMLVDQAHDDTVQSATKIYAVLGFEQSFLLDDELRHRVAEISHLIDIAVAGAVPGYSLPEIAFLSRSETRMLMGAWSRGSALPDSIEGWSEVRQLRPQIEAQWQANLRDRGLSISIPPLSTY